MIKSASECTVKIFMDCLFNSNYPALGEGEEHELFEAWQEIYMQYIDLSGIAQTTELHLLKTIQGLRCRLTLLDMYVKLHKDCLRVVGQPFFPAFKEMKKYGHSLWWDKDNSDIKIFIEKLDQVTVREKRYEVELAEKMNELLQYKKNISDSNPDQVIIRKDFIRQLNQLQKHGFQIDRDKTTVEDLALMVLDYTAHIEGEQMNYKR